MIGSSIEGGKEYWSAGPAPRRMTKRGTSANNAPAPMRFAFSPTLLALLCAGVFHAEAQTAASRVAVSEPLVDLARACPDIVIDLRYATARNITGKPIYPPGARALLRKRVADRLNQAQRYLEERGFGLKVWDAYRPPWAQKILWHAIKNPAYVVEPSATGSLHSWGAAVDVTLVDFRGREKRMPTDFDAFSEAARYDYKGGDAEIAANLSLLKRAMAEAGFRHIRDEWWHYSAAELRGYGPLDVPLADSSQELARADEPAPPPKAIEPAAPKRGTRTKRPLFP